MPWHHTSSCPQHSNTQGTAQCSSGSSPALCRIECQLLLLAGYCWCWCCCLSCSYSYSYFPAVVSYPNCHTQYSVHCPSLICLTLSGSQMRSSCCHSSSWILRCCAIESRIEKAHNYRSAMEFIQTYSAGSRVGICPSWTLHTASIWSWYPVLSQCPLPNCTVHLWRGGNPCSPTPSGPFLMWTHISACSTLSTCLSAPSLKIMLKKDIGRCLVHFSATYVM